MFLSVSRSALLLVISETESLSLSGSFTRSFDLELSLGFIVEFLRLSGECLDRDADRALSLCGRASSFDRESLCLLIVPLFDPESRTYSRLRALLL